MAKKSLGIECDPTEHGPNPIKAPTNDSCFFHPTKKQGRQVMLQSRMKLFRDVDVNRDLLRSRRRCMQRQVVRISGACVLTILIVSSVEAGLIYLIL